MPGVYPTAPGGATNPPRKLLDQVRDVLRVKHYSYRTEQAYVGWIRRFILFHDKRHPMEMGGPEVEQFLTWLATDRTVVASTQTQALSALLFRYKHVLRIELPLLDAVRAKRPKRLPVVLSQQELQRLLAAVEGAHGIYRMLAGMMYGAGLRLMECCRLRVKDVDFERGQIIIRANEKGVRTNPVRHEICAAQATQNTQFSWTCALASSRAYWAAWLARSATKCVSGTSRA